MSWEHFHQIYKVPNKYLKVNIEDLSVYGSSVYDSIMQFYVKPHSLLLQGDVGRGKTYLTFGLIKWLLRSIHVSDIKWFNATTLDERVGEEIKKYGSSSHFVNQLCEIDYLFIDDFGVEGSRERAERNYYQLLDRRLSDDKVTIISTNLSNTEILETFGSRIDSRLSQCTKIIFNGEDLRKKGL